MADLAGKDEIFDELIARYKTTYPDEDTAVLEADVTRAAVDARHAKNTVLAELPEPLNDQRVPRDLPVLQGLMTIIKQNAKRATPLWQRLLRGYLFNAQPTPIADRVGQARQHLSDAARQLIAQGLPAEAGQ
jgi:hypothetical protein